MDFGTYEKFMKKKLKEVNYEHNLFKKSFKKFDKDGDGFVTFEELRVASKVWEPVCLMERFNVILKKLISTKMAR